MVEDSKKKQNQKQIAMRLKDSIREIKLKKIPLQREVSSNHIHKVMKKGPKILSMLEVPKTRIQSTQKKACMKNNKLSRSKATGS